MLMILAVLVAVAAAVAFMWQFGPTRWGSPARSNVFAAVAGCAVAAVVLLMVSH